MYGSEKVKKNIHMNIFLNAMIIKISYSPPGLLKCVSGTLQNGRYTLSYSSGRYADGVHLSAIWGNRAFVH